uniref:Uncharacterized protein n=1 Tax=Ditylenchus dipsaci TaxID=166011 RepID=A0A915CQ52_9BILA
MSDLSSSQITSTASEAEQLKQQGNDGKLSGLLNRCLAYLKLKRYEEALKDADQSILLALIGLKKEAEAVDCLQQCLDIRHDPAINDLIQEIKPSANKFSSLTVLRPPYNLFQLELADGSEIDDTVMEFLQNVDAACFVDNALAFNSVHMEMAADMGWMNELFGDAGIFNPSLIQLNGIRGIDSKYLCDALITLKSFQLARKIVLIDFVQLPDISRYPEAAAAACLKIDSGTLIAWLNNRLDNAVPVRKASERIFNIQTELIEDRLDDVIDKMFEDFLSDDRPTSFSLLVHRPTGSIYSEDNGWPSSQITGEAEKTGRAAVNHKTGEMMRVRLLSVHNYGYVDDGKADESANQGEMSCAGDDLYVERFSGKEEDSHWATAFQNIRAAEDKRNQEGNETRKVVPLCLCVKIQNLYSHPKHLLNSSKANLINEKFDLNSPKIDEYYQRILKKAENIKKMHFENLETKSAKTIKNELETNLENTSEKNISMILECKQFMLDITKETEDDFSVNLIQFFQSVKDAHVKRIYEMANIQSSVLDKNMIEMMYKQHDTNHPTNKKALIKHPKKK